MNIIYNVIFSILFLVAVLMQGQCTAQSRIVNRSNFIVDVYYGVSFSNFVVINQFGVGKINNLIGPIGLKFETMVTDKIGLGIDLNFSQTSISWINNSTYNNGTYYSYCNYDETHFRALLNFSNHFMTTERSDTYSSLRVGLNSVNYSLNTNNPSLYRSYSFFPITIPVSFRIAVGHKFFFNNNIGINIEAGFGGGPLISGGLTFKFAKHTRNIKDSVTTTDLSKDEAKSIGYTFSNDSANSLSIPRNNFSISYNPVNYGNGYSYAGGLFIINYSRFFNLSDVFILSAQGGIGIVNRVVGGDLSGGLLVGRRSLRFDATFVYFRAFEYNYGQKFSTDIGARYFFMKRNKCSAKAYFSIPHNSYAKTAFGVAFAYHFQY